MNENDERLYRRLQDTLIVGVIDLDSEWARMPMDVHDAAEALAQAISCKNRNENHLKFHRAIVADRLRSTPVNGKSRSETCIMSELQLAPEVLDAEDRLLEAKLEVDLWRALCDALQTKREALKELGNDVRSAYTTPAAIHRTALELKAHRDTQSAAAATA